MHPLCFYIRKLRGIEANVLDCDIGVSKFEIYSSYYDPYGINALRKSINLIISRW